MDAILFGEQATAGQVLARVGDVQPPVCRPVKCLPVLIVQQPEFGIHQRVHRLVLDLERDLIGRCVHRHRDQAARVAGICGTASHLVH